MIHIDNLDGEGTIFINTDDGTKSIGHVEEEYVDIMQEVLKEVKRLREQYTELREALVGDSPNWTHEELIEKALELTKPAELEFGEWHTDEGDDEE